MEIHPEGNLGLLIPTGAAGASSEAMVIGPSVLTTVGMSLSIGSSWQASSDVILNGESMSITETVTRVTTALKTLKCFPFQTTQNATRKSESRATGCGCDALPVVESLIDGEPKWSNTPLPIAPESVIAPVSPLRGTGTAAKPSWEPIILARKPLTGTVSQNVLAHGTGALNIDGCRVETGGERLAVPQSDPAKRAGTVGTDLGITRVEVEDFQRAQAESIERTNTLGRWPANTILTHLDECEQVGTRKVKASAPASGPTLSATESVAHGDYTGERSEVPNYADEDGTETVTAWNCAEGCPVAELDRQAGKLGITTVNHKAQDYDSNVKSGLGGMAGQLSGYGDTGGASRFFYTAKSSRAERQAGLGKEAGVERNLHPT